MLPFNPLSIKVPLVNDYAILNKSYILIILFTLLWGQSQIKKIRCNSKKECNGEVILKNRVNYLNTFITIVVI